MKKTITLLLVAFLLVGTLGVTIAEENTTDDNSTLDENVTAPSDDDAEDVEAPEMEEEFEEIEIPEARRTSFLNRLRFTFTFDKEKKIEKALEMAEEKLAYADLIAEENPERAAEIYEEYAELLEKAQEILADIESRADDEDDSSEDIGELARIQARFEKHQETTDAIYNRALERFEMNNASAEKIERFEGFHDRANKRNEEALAKAIEKQEDALIKHKALTGMSDDELEDLLEGIEEREGIADEREEREEREEKRLEEIKRTKEQSIERIMDNPNLSEERKEEIKNRFEIAKQERERVEEALKEKRENFEEQREDAGERLKNIVENELEKRNSDDDSDDDESLDDLE